MREPINILLVVLAGGRHDRLSCFGAERETTPFIDAVAREGVRFPLAITPAAASLAAHASLLTGVFPSSHGATEESRVLTSRHRLLPEYLKAAGYRTAAFCTSPSVSPATGLGRGFDVFSTQRTGGRFTGAARFYARKASDRVLGRQDAGARRTTQALLDWIGSGTAPFLAFVHYNETHLPYGPPAPYDRVFLPRGASDAHVAAVNRDAAAQLAGRGPIGAEEATVLGALYDGALRYIDMRLKEIADALAWAGQWDRTLLIITADHGEYLGEQGLIGHRVGLGDPLLRIPLVIRCPERIPGGYVVEELAQLTDVVPTVLALAGAHAQGDGLAGRPLFRDGRATVGPAFAITERFRPSVSDRPGRQGPGGEARPVDVRMKAIRSRREKFVWRSDEANELYDLARDPREGRNLVAAEPVRAEALRRALFDWLASIERAEGSGAAPEIDAAARARLERLGSAD